MRPYYDHERGYQAIAARGGTGWDDCPTLAAPAHDSYDALTAFLASPLATGDGDALELGCGGGQASLLLAARGYRVTGVDFAPTAIELARRNATAAGAEIRFFEGDCLALDAVDAAAFDLVVDNHLLHCLIGPDRGRMLREAARVLRPDGLLFSDTMSREGDQLALEQHGFDPVTFVSRNGSRYLTGARELDDELVAAGFEIVSRTARPSSEPGFGAMLVRVARPR